jgi:hypothetical protein
MEANQSPAADADLPRPPTPSGNSAEAAVQREEGSSSLASRAKSSATDKFPELTDAQLVMLGELARNDVLWGHGRIYSNVATTLNSKASGDSGAQSTEEQQAEVLGLWADEHERRTTSTKTGNSGNTS